MRTLNRDARVAGFLYLLVIVVGFLDLEILPGRFIKSGDAVATAHNITGHQSLFRTLIASDLIAGVLWLLVVLALYRLLKNVDRTQAVLMLILGALLQVPLYFIMPVSYAGALLILTNPSIAPAFSVVQRDAMAMLFLRLHGYQLLTSLVFAGLWLFPFGVLVYKSGFLPRILGVWLIADGFAWLAIVFTGIFAPQNAGMVRTITTPLTVAEIAIALWLAILGSRRFANFVHVTSA
jgi:hypothetical protein